MPPTDSAKPARERFDQERITQVPLNPQHFGTFLAVVDAGGKLSAAARVLGMSQPGVTHQLNELEKRLGILLLDRARGRAARVTRAGRVFERYARSIVGMQSALYADLDQLAHEVSGHLRVGVSHGPAEGWLPVLLCEFADQHPSVRVEVRMESALTLVEQVAASTLEIAIVGGRWNQPSVQFDPVRRDEAVFVAAPDHPLAARTSLSLDDLSGARLLLQSSGSALRIELEHALAKAGSSLAQFQVLGEFGSHRGVISAAAAGHGIACTWESVVRTELDAGLLVALDTEQLLDGVHYLVRRADRRLSRRAAALLESLRRAQVSSELAATGAPS